MKTGIQLSSLSEIDIELSEKDIEVLCKYVKDINPPNCYVEIGTKYGGSALVAKKAAKEEVDIYSIDHNPDFKMWDGKENEYGITFIKKTSLEAAKDWDKPIAVLFIDGDHDQAAIDFGAWEKYLISGAIILFHDYAVHSPKVIADCQAILRNERSYKVIYAPPEESRIDTSILQMRKL